MIVTTKGKEIEGGKFELYDEKTTANKLAKEIVAHAMEMAGYARESNVWNWDKMTEKESDEVMKSVEKKMYGCLKYMGL